MKTKNLWPLCVVGIIFLVLAVSGCSSSGDNTTQTQSSTVDVKNVTVSNSGDGFYTVKAVITPKENKDYLEMDAIWYDKSGAVIETSSLFWNVDNPKSGQVYKASGEEDFYQKGKPTKVDVYLFDDVFSGGDTSDAIWNKTLKIKN